jgi:DNA-binding transcriptional regulator GbsR (MarR family)
MSEEAALLHEVADTVGALMEFWGFKRVMGRLWATLYLEGEPMPVHDLCERTGISTGAASMTLSELEHWGVVVRTRRPGDRREYFEAETDVWKMISRVLRERELMQIERALEVFERARAAIAGGKYGVVEAFRARRKLERIAKLADLAKVGKTLLLAVVQQGKADLGPLMRFARAASATLSGAGKKRG